jgi:hypothetical protein
MNIYRLITGPDDNAFCHRVTLALNKGWSLHGSPALTYDPVQERTVCAQAVYKQVDGMDYDPEMKLGEQ